jgi:aspartate/methionine/tyrosine aminotransferase
VRLNPLTVAVADSPIGMAHGLAGQRVNRRPLLDLAQAAPQYPPADAVVEHVTATARDPHGGQYVVTVGGLPHLREAFAADLSEAYRGPVEPEHVFVTAGCNQAFCLVAGALTVPGDEVVLVLPFYFNHDMWLRMNGVRPVYLDPGPDQVPTPEAVAELLTSRTRALVVVTPGNPSGLTVPPERITALAELAARRGIALILDETYRSFRDTTEPAHPLFTDPGWSETVVSLHSFSKEFAIPGYRVGAVVGAPRLHRQLAKLLDCVAISAPRIGQEAAWAGLARARDWRAARAAEIAGRRARFRELMAGRPGGFELLAAGGVFGWLRHPFADRSTEDVVRALVLEHDTLVIPGTAFLPADQGTLRVSLINAEQAQLADFADRLDAAGSAPVRRTAAPAG